MNRAVEALRGMCRNALLVAQDPGAQENDVLAAIEVLGAVGRRLPPDEALLSDLAKIGHVHVRSVSVVAAIVGLLRALAPPSAALHGSFLTLARRAHAAGATATLAALDALGITPARAQQPAAAMPAAPLARDDGSDDPALGASFTQLRIGIVGCDDVGLSAVRRLRRKFPGVASSLLVGIGTDGARYGVADGGRCHDLSSAGSLGPLLAGLDLVFVVADPMGMEGAVFAAVAAHLAKESGAVVLAVLEAPCEPVEPGQALEQERAMSAVRTHAHSVFVAGPGDTAHPSSAVHLVETLVSMIHGDGVIGFCWDDAQELLRAGHSLAVGAGTAEGSDRAIRAADLAMSRIGDGSLAVPSACLVNVVGTDFALREIELATRHVAARIGEDVEIFIAAQLDPSPDAPLCVTVITASAAKAAVRPAPI